MNTIAPNCANLHFAKIFNKNEFKNKYLSENQPPKKNSPSKETLPPKENSKTNSKIKKAFKFLFITSTLTLCAFALLKGRKTFNIQKNANEILLNASRKYEEVLDNFENLKLNKSDKNSLNNASQNISLYNFKSKDSVKSCLFENLSDDFSRKSIFIDGKLSTIEEFNGKKEKNKYFFNPETGALEKFYKNFIMDNDKRTIAPEIFYFENNKLKNHIKTA